jgi:hypothetical protein
MNTYAESKKTLDRIRSEYGCKGDLCFRGAIHHVFEYGIKDTCDDWCYQHRVDEINAYHDEAEAEGKNLFIARGFELAVLECAREIAQVNISDLILYIQKEVWMGHEGGIDYKRAIDLLKGCMSNIEMWNDCQCVLTLHELEDIGFDDDEIVELGFGYLLDAREDEEDD